MRAAHHRVVGRTRVEPDVEDVGRLVVLRGFFFRQEVRRLRARPGFDAALFDHVGHLVHDFERARVEFPGRLVEEEGERHAPVALTRDAPVRAVLDHRVETVDAPGRRELRVFGCAGVFRTPLVSSVGSSMRTNHCEVAR